MLRQALFSLRSELRNATPSASSYRAFHSSSTTPAAAATATVGISKRKAPPSRIEGQFKVYKPVTPGIRHLKRPVSPHLYEGPPLRLLTIAKRKTGGRNKTGQITVRSRGGGHKQRLRSVDFHRFDPGKADVIRIEFDPGRSAHIALIHHRDPKAKRPVSYILAPDSLRAGDVVESFRDGIPDGLVDGYVDVRRRNRLEIKDRKLDQAGVTRVDVEGGTTAFPETIAPISNTGAPTSLDRQYSDFQAPEPASNQHLDASAQLSLGILRTLTIKPGNVLPLRLIPTGVEIHCISLSPFGPGQLVRSAGSVGEVVAQEENGKYTQVRLQSGEVRKINQECVATIGRVSNINWKHRQLGKAGRARNLGRRPHVRGMAMNAVDHPHGGGRGKSKGNKHPRSIYGWLTKGKRTRKPGPHGHKGSNKFVVKERPRGKQRRT